MLLAHAFAERGHEVDLVYDGPAVHDGGVHWLPSAPDRNFDLAISNRWARFFRGVVWMHNTVTPMWSISQGDLRAIAKYRPDVVVLSRHQERRISSLLPYARLVLIPHGQAAEFLPRTSTRAPPAAVAVFASQSYRGLDWTVDTWRRFIRPRSPQAEFHVYEPGATLDPGEWGDGITIKGSRPLHEIATAFAAARVLMYPGHKNETFCKVAAQATCSGTPIVTRGIGSLAERVEHGNGVVAWSRKDFADAALEVLTNDDTWSVLHSRTHDHPDRRSWDWCAAQWEEAFL